MVEANSGRKTFEKHKKLILRCVVITRVFPVVFRKWLFEHFRMTNGKLGFLLRYILIKTLAYQVGDNVAIFPGCFFFHLDRLSIGDNVSIHEMCYIDAEGTVILGNNVSISHKVTILSSNHRFDNKQVPIKYQGMVCKRTMIQDNCWIGTAAIILYGNTIESGSIIGAGAVVTKSISKNSIATGIPAKVIKSRV